MLKYKRVGLTAKRHLEQKEHIVSTIVDIVRKTGAEIVIDRSSMDDVSCVRTFDDIKKDNIDVLLAIGGDGTILRAVRELPDFSVPILSVNSGTVGFLAEVALDEAPALLPMLLSGEGRLEERGVLSVMVTREQKNVFQSFALNEAAISQGTIARLLDLRTSVDTTPLATFHADGLIVATPTGSTAYSLAAGGPVIHPQLSALILTPINPHSLTQKPVVLAGESVIDIDVINTNERHFETHVSLTLDGQLYFELKRDDRVTAAMHAETVKFLRRNEDMFFHTLRTKLKWGERL
jgi:NAD+ kinase